MLLSTFLSENFSQLINYDFIFVLSRDLKVLNHPDEQRIWFGRNSLPKRLMQSQFHSIATCDSSHSLNDTFSEYVLSQDGKWSFIAPQVAPSFREILESSPLAADSLGKIQGLDKSVFLTVE